MNYKKKLTDPQWQKRRLEIFQRDKFQCCFCHSKTKELHVHHKQYLPGREPWEYDSKDLLTLCYQCHESDHITNGSITRFLNFIQIAKSCDTQDLKFHVANIPHTLTEEQYWTVMGVICERENQPIPLTGEVLFNLLSDYGEDTLKEFASDPAEYGEETSEMAKGILSERHKLKETSEDVSNYKELIESTIQNIYDNDNQ